MTFYNIIFGILFVAAIRELMRSFLLGDTWDGFFRAATLCILIFSDTIYTSVVIEGQKKRYGMKMKFLDLGSFLLLSMAVITINPTDTSLFEVDSTAKLSEFAARYGFSVESLFWFLLACYIVILAAWNYLGGTYRGLRRSRWVVGVQPAMFVLFILLFVITSPSERIPWVHGEGFHALETLAGWMRLLAMVAAGLYLLGYKLYLAKLLRQVVTLEPLTYCDAQAIRCWPPYTGRYAPLDYALRDDGWLDWFPESTTARRWGAWQDGELVGFAILTHIHDGTAEFYIAVKKTQHRKGLGRDITEQVVFDLGRGELGLKRIYLKVRDWHSTGIHLYESVGFKKCGEVSEDIQGTPVKFVLMEIHLAAPPLPPQPEKPAPETGNAKADAASHSDATPPAEDGPPEPPV